MGETISEAIAADHASFDEYADNLKTATDDAEKVRWRNQLTWTVARHALSEELTLYPAMEKHLGDEGVKLTKTDKEQHQAVGIRYILFRACPLTEDIGQKYPLRAAGHDTTGPQVHAPARYPPQQPPPPH